MQSLWRKSRAETKHITQRRSDLPGGDAPAEGGLVLHAGVKGDLIGGGGLQSADVVDGHLGHPGDGIGAGAQFGGEGDGIAGAEGMDLAEVVAHPPVVVE